MNATSATHRRPTLTREELLTLPVSIDLSTANRALGIGRSTGYALARSGKYPVRVLRFGNAYRVVTADLHRLLGLTEAPSHESQVDAATA